MSISNLLDSVVLPYEALNVYSINSQLPISVTDYSYAYLPTTGSGYTAAISGGSSSAINFDWASAQTHGSYIIEGSSPSIAKITHAGHYEINVSINSGVFNQNQILAGSTFLINNQNIALQILNGGVTIAAAVVPKDSFIVVSGNPIAAGGYLFNTINLSYIANLNVNDEIQIRLNSNCTSIIGTVQYDANSYIGLYGVTDYVTIKYLG